MTTEVTLSDATPVAVIGDGDIAAASGHVNVGAVGRVRVSNMDVNGRVFYRQGQQVGNPRGIGSAPAVTAARHEIAPQQHVDLPLPVDGRRVWWFWTSGRTARIAISEAP